MAKIPGEFVPLNVRYRRDRSIRRAGASAELIYIRSLAMAKRDDTNGVIEDYDLDELTEGIDDPKTAVAALVEHQLWTARTDHSWSVRSWQKWNPSGQSSAEGKRGNHVRWHVKEGVVKPDCQFCLESSAEDRGPIAPRIAPRLGEDIAPDSQVRVEKSKRESRKNVSSEVADAPVRPDIEQLLDHLDAAIKASDPEAKLPSRTKKNLDAARLLIDRDGKTVAQVKACIDFALADEFWRTNIRSMSKLREKYDQLRAKASRVAPKLDAAPPAYWTAPPPPDDWAGDLGEWNRKCWAERRAS